MKTEIWGAAEVVPARCKRVGQQHLAPAGKASATPMASSESRLLTGAPASLRNASRAASR
jgi:hypothetical protein